MLMKLAGPIIIRIGEMWEILAYNWFELIVKKRIHSVGVGTKIHRKAIFKSKAKILIGSHCLISELSIIDGKTSADVGVTIGNYVEIKPKAYISTNNARIEIQDYCGIGHNTWIGGKGDIVIGENTLIGMNTVIISSSHDYNNITIPFYSGNEIISKIIIGRNVWIGANCTILAGTTIGDDSVIAAGTVVKTEVPKNSIISGVPGDYRIKLKKNNINESANQANASDS